MTFVCGRGYAEVQILKEWKWPYLLNRVEYRNYITTLAFYDRHGSDSILSPQCNSWKVIHFPTHYMGLQGLLLNILQ